MVFLKKSAAVLVLVLVCLCFAHPVSAAANGRITFYVAGDEYNVKNPVCEDGRMFLPLKEATDMAGEILGICEYRVDFEGGADNGDSNGIVRITAGDKRLEMFIGGRIAILNNGEVLCDAPPFLRNGEVYVPLRFVAEKMGLTVTWEPSLPAVSLMDTGELNDISALLGGANGEYDKETKTELTYSSAAVIKGKMGGIVNGAVHWEDGYFLNTAVTTSLNIQQDAMNKFEHVTAGALYSGGGSLYVETYDNGEFSYTRSWGDANWIKSESPLNRISEDYYDMARTVREVYNPYYNLTSTTGFYALKLSENPKDDKTLTGNVGLTEEMVAGTLDQLARFYGIEILDNNLSVTYSGPVKVDYLFNADGIIDSMRVDYGLTVEFDATTQAGITRFRYECKFENEIRDFVIGAEFDSKIPTEIISNAAETVRLYGEEATNHVVPEE